MAERGRVNATTPIEIIEKEAVEAIAGASACVENFNQAAQRITMVFGGVDLTPAKEYLRQTVCSVAGKVVKQAQNEISKTTGVDTRRFITAPPSASGQPPDQIRPSEPEIKSVWERVSCALGNC